MKRLLLLILTSILASTWGASVVSADAGQGYPFDERIEPYPRPIMATPLVTRFDFEHQPNDRASWNAVNCAAEVQGGRLHVESPAADPYLIGPPIEAAASGPLLVALRMRATTGGPGQVFWTTKAAPHWSETQSQRFPMKRDGDWHVYEVPIEAEGPLARIRLDPGVGKGTTEVDWIEIRRRLLHPIHVRSFKVTPERAEIRCAVENHGDNAAEVVATLKIDGAEIESSRVGAAPGQVTDQEFAWDLADHRSVKQPFFRVAVSITCGASPAVTRAAVVHDPDAPMADGESTRLVFGDGAVQFARDGRGARLYHQEQLVGIIAPLVWDIASPGEPPTTESLDFPLELVQESGDRLVFRGGPVRTLNFHVEGDRLGFRLDASRALHGPVIRAAGQLEQGLLPGVEYLGHGEHSSSSADIETDERIRFAPDPLHLTMPMAAVVTDRGGLAMAWDDTSLQPIFAVPDFLTGTPEPRMNLWGEQLAGVLRTAPAFGLPGGRLEDAILWDVRRRGGLPPLPPTPRSVGDQFDLCLAGLTESIARNEDGWAHAVVPGDPSRFPHRYFADCASTVWHLTGEMPDVPRLVPGGAHLPNHCAFFIDREVDTWRDWIDRGAAGLRKSQRPDGSWRYSGEFRRGHWEDTASGLVGRNAAQLFDHVRYTGNDASRRAALHALEFLQRFRTPRGAQTWEISLHTPDILASAWCTIAYVRGYELTGRQEYLELARRWAITGVPFVYQWSDYPIMRYATIPVLGATHWQRPNWIGLPVQWCGLDYAQAVLLLAEHDDTLDWPRMAEGILIAGEQMQYPDGPSIGLLPDGFVLAEQRRLPADINPCVLVRLRRIFERLPATLQVATEPSHRVVAPFPVRIENSRAILDDDAGGRYQILVDGNRIVEVDAADSDGVRLTP